LIGLTIEERKSLPKLGDKSQAFVTKALEVATQNPDFLPRSFDLYEMRRDVELFETLYPVLLSLIQLQELVNDQKSLRSAMLVPLGQSSLAGTSCHRVRVASPSGEAAPFGSIATKWSTAIPNPQRLLRKREAPSGVYVSLCSTCN
jgi:hypothetical protein